MCSTTTILLAIPFSLGNRGILLNLPHVDLTSDFHKRQSINLWQMSSHQSNWHIHQNICSNSLTPHSKVKHSRTIPNEGKFVRKEDVSIKYQQHKTPCFVEFHTTFGSVNRSPRWNMMLLDGVPQNFTADQLIIVINQSSSPSLWWRIRGLWYSYWSQTRMFFSAIFFKICTWLFTNKSPWRIKRCTNCIGYLHLWHCICRRRCYTSGYSWKTESCACPYQFLGQPLWPRHKYLPNKNIVHWLIKYWETQSWKLFLDSNNLDLFYYGMDKPKMQ